ncbi:MAG: hypothetical protein ABID79_04890 [Elusimicrobiota bacterium]
MRKVLQVSRSGILVGFSTLLFTICYAKVNIGISGGYSTFAMADFNDNVEVSGEKLRGGSDFVLNVSLNVSEKFRMGLGLGSIYGTTVIDRTTYTKTEAQVLAIPITIDASYILKEISPDKLYLTANIGLGCAPVILGSKYSITGLGDAVSYYTGSAGLFQIGTGIIYKVFKKLDLTTDLGLRYMRSTEFENVDYINGSDFNLDFSGIFVRGGLRF